MNEQADERTQDRSDIIRHNFTYHAPNDHQIARMSMLREVALQLALMIEQLTPTSREQSLALTSLEQVTFWANAAIARED